MVRAAVPEKFVQRTGTICENRAGLRFGMTLACVCSSSTGIRLTAWPCRNC